MPLIELSDAVEVVDGYKRRNPDSWSLCNSIRCDIGELPTLSPDEVRGVVRCKDCTFGKHETDGKTVILHSNGSVYEPTSNELILNKIADATGLPPHGDLISKQTALAALYSDYAYAAMDVIEKEVPVVVPAEREGEDAPD